MKTLRMFAVGLMFAALCAVSASAQTTPAAPAATAAGKIVVIDTGAFGDPKAGITKYVGAYSTLDTEFKPLQTELTGMQTKIQGLEKEITSLRDQASKPNSPVSAASVQAKVDEYERLAVDFKRKQEDGKSRFEKRQQALMAPIMQDIYKAYNEFTKKNGYLMVLDVGKLAEAGIILGLDDTADMTKAFITFYNARPATTATTAAPR